MAILIYTMEQQYQVRTKLTEDRCVLPCDVIPQHYDIELDVDLDTSIFSGLVVAKIHFVYTTDKIVLNARDLNICSTSSFLAIGLEKYVTVSINLVGIISVVLCMMIKRSKFRLIFLKTSNVEQMAPFGYFSMEKLATSLLDFISPHTRQEIM